MRLARLRCEPTRLSALLLTHEHADHARGVGALARRFNLPVWMTVGTFRALKALLTPLSTVQLFSPHEPFEIGDILVTPYPVPHDAREPSQFAFSAGSVRLGLLTDTGSITSHIESVLYDCDGLFLECNHDREMLWGGPYPEPVKTRIASQFGHLDNADAAELLSRLNHRRLQHLVAMHLSETNNTPELARAALSTILQCAPEWIQVASQRSGLAWRTLLASPV